jgi:hypothetical protein
MNHASVEAARSRSDNGSGSVPAIVSTVARLIVLPVVASLLLAWWVTGDVSEVAPNANPDVIIDLPWAETNAAALGVAGLGLALVVTLDVALHWRSGRPVAKAVALSTITGTLGGVALRILTARTDGANIGGGAVIVFGPFVLGPLLIAAGRGAWHATRARRATPNRSQQ